MKGQITLGRKILLRQACILAMLVALCFVGPSLPGRRHHARNEQLLQGISIIGNEKENAIRAGETKISAYLASVQKNAEFANVITAATLVVDKLNLSIPRATSAGSVIQPFSRLFLPGYYAFLFRYALF